MKRFVNGLIVGSIVASMIGVLGNNKRIQKKRLLGSRDFGRNMNRLYKTTKKSMNILKNR